MSIEAEGTVLLLVSLFKFRFALTCGPSGDWSQEVVAELEKANRHFAGEDLWRHVLLFDLLERLVLWTLCLAPGSTRPSSIVPTRMRSPRSLLAEPWQSVEKRSCGALCAGQAFRIIPPFLGCC